MSRLDLSKSNLSGVFWRSGRWGTVEKILSASYVVSADNPPVHMLNPNGGSYNITLPPVSRGLVFFVCNTGTGTLTVKDANGATLAILTTGQASGFVSSLTAWAQLSGSGSGSALTSNLDFHGYYAYDSTKANDPQFYFGEGTDGLNWFFQSTADPVNGGGVFFEVDGPGTGGTSFYTYRNNAVPHDSDTIAAYQMAGNNDAGDYIPYGQFVVYALDVSAGLESSEFVINIMAHGVGTDALLLSPGNASFELSSDDYGGVSIIGRSPGAGGPFFYVSHLSPSPAPGDEMGFTFNARNSVAADYEVGGIIAVVVDKTAGSEDSMITFRTVVAGVPYSNQLVVGSGLIAGDSGSDLFPGTGNLAFATGKGIFDNAGNEQLLFTKTALADSWFQITNGIAGYTGAPNGTQGVFLKAKSGTGTTSTMTFGFDDGFGNTDGFFNFDAGFCNGAGMEFFSRTTAQYGPGVYLSHYTASPAAADIPGSLNISGYNSAAASTSWASLYSTITVPTAAAESAYFAIDTMHAGLAVTSATFERSSFGAGGAYCIDIRSGGSAYPWPGFYCDQNMMFNVADGKNYDFYFGHSSVWVVSPSEVGSYYYAGESVNVAQLSAGRIDPTPSYNDAVIGMYGYFSRDESRYIDSGWIYNLMEIATNGAERFRWDFANAFQTSLTVEESETFSFTYNSLELHGYLDSGRLASAPPNGSSGTARIFADVDAGVTEICVMFPTGAKVVLAREGDPDMKFLLDEMKAQRAEQQLTNVLLAEQINQLLKLNNFPNASPGFDDDALERLRADLLNNVR